MRIGCIAGSEIICDGCAKVMKYPQRYLLIEGEEAVAEAGRVRYCLDCALDKGYAAKRLEKGEEILTFFADQPALPE